MSKKVNNLRKRIRQLEQQNSKELRDIAQREADLAIKTRQFEFRAKQKTADGLVSIVLRRPGEFRDCPGKIYSFQLVVDFDGLRYMVFRDQRDIRQSYALLGWMEGQLINELKKLYDDILRAEYPEMRQVRREA